MKKPSSKVTIGHCVYFENTKKTMWWTGRDWTDEKSERIVYVKKSGATGVAKRRQKLVACEVKVGTVFRGESFRQR